MEEIRVKNRELIFLTGGLIVGFVVGVILIGSSDEMRTDLFGTVGDTGGSNSDIEFDELTFYEIEFDDAKDWLSEVEPEVSEELAEDLDHVNGLGDTDDLGEYFTEVQDSIDTVLSTMHRTLLEGIDLEDAIRTRVSTCIALNNDPYSLSGPGVYVYVQVPEDMVETVPVGWESLEGPKEQNMLYSTTCYSDSDG